MTSKLSADPSDKLHAAFHHAYPDANDDLSKAYRTACEHWFAQLTASERWVMLTVTIMYAQGDEDKAEEITSQLPLATMFRAATIDDRDVWHAALRRRCYARGVGAHRSAARRGRDLAGAETWHWILNAIERG
jgi:hypothetical protein